MSALCTSQNELDDCWLRFMRMTSGLPSVRPISTNRVHDGWTRKI